MKWRSLNGRWKAVLYTERGDERKEGAEWKVGSSPVFAHNTQRGGMIGRGVHGPIHSPTHPPDVRHMAVEWDVPGVVPSLGGQVGEERLDEPLGGELPAVELVDTWVDVELVLLLCAHE